MLVPLNMTYTKGSSKIYILDTAHSLKSLLDYAAVHGGCANITFDIKQLNFKKHNFHPFHMHNISFTCFTSINTQAERQRHTNALRDATEAAHIR